jgi:N-acetylmuramoyl-L-alanine amidase
MRKLGEALRKLGSPALVAALALHPEPALPSPPLRVVSVRHFASAAQTRIVVELSAPGRPSLEAIAGSPGGPPTRLYLDFPGAEIGPAIATSTDLPVGPVAMLRVGKRDVHTTRIVLASRNLDSYEVGRLHDPPRVVLDLRAPPPGVGRPGRAAAAETGDSRRGSPKAAVPTREAPLPSAPPVPPPSGAKAPNTAQAAVGRLRAPMASPKIVLDPGHGGKDPGARGVGGIVEKDVVLDITRLVAERLRNELGASVVLTRNRDVFVPLEDRTALANAEGADLFISIHANASTHPRLAGVETYYLNNTDDRATIRLAAMENGLGPAGATLRTRTPDLSYIVSDLVQQGKLDDSVTLARALQRGVLRRLSEEHPEVPDLGVKQGPFYVLVGAHMPCVLVEVAFLTNPMEGKRLNTPSYRATIAAGLVEGIRHYMDQQRVAHTL